MDKLQAIMEGLSRIEAMLDDMDVKSTDDMRNPKDDMAPMDDAPTTSATDDSLAEGMPDEEAAESPEEESQEDGDSGMSDALGKMADDGDLKAKAAMMTFKRGKR